MFREEKREFSRRPTTFPAFLLFLFAPLLTRSPCAYSLPARSGRWRATAHGQSRPSISLVPPIVQFRITSRFRCVRLHARRPQPAVRRHSVHGIDIVSRGTSTY